ncbi:hypothetical protein SteCoe_16206 [Stentor coeruleus]|uniref:PH domain-containing protein n=1 Tax=Stentor coeruleus TaxID=5963 RepID=A0A1R2C1T2_9CILI|nr:hypothetical protein SteCoe_16206 [Stentor coeruleus]
MYEEKYIEKNYRGPMIIRCFLKKLKSEGSFSKFLTKFNKRFFILDLNNYFFGYQDSKTSSNFRRQQLIDLTKVDPNPIITVICEWSSSFVVEISNRIYTLFTHTKSLHKDWTDGLKALIRPNELFKSNLDQQKAFLRSMGKEKKDSKKEDDSLNDWKDKNLIFRNNNSPEEPPDLLFTWKNRENSQVKLKFEKLEFDKGGGQSLVENTTSYIGNKNIVEEKIISGKNTEDRPKFFMIKGDFKDECDKNEVKQKIKNENTDEEDEVSLVYSPKFSKKDDDDFDVKILIILPASCSSRERKIQEKTKQVEGKKYYLENDFKEIIKESSKNIHPMSNGIVDMMADDDNLGLNVVEVHPKLYFKKKSLKGNFTKASKIITKTLNPSLSPKKITTSYIQTPENITKLYRTSSEKKNPSIQVELKKTKSPIISKNHIRTMDNNWDDDSKDNTKNHHKIITLGNITVPPITKKTTAKIIEKPEIVPDNGFTDKKKNGDSSRRWDDKRGGKGQVVFEEKKYDKGRKDDCNWDEWDD